MYDEADRIVGSVKKPSLAIVSAIKAVAFPRRGRGHRPQIVPRPPNFGALLTHCGQLILRKVSKFDAISCQIVRLNAQNSISAPDPAGGAYSAPLDPLAVLFRYYLGLRVRGVVTALKPVRAEQVRRPE